MNFTPAQQQAITLDTDMVVTAGAGSGKTRVLVERYLRILTNLPTDVDVSSILAITFTDKAAREMRDRVRTTVEARARSAPRNERALWEERRTTIESARIGTIHSFCASILRNHPAETGLDPRFRVLDPIESHMLLGKSVEKTLEQAIKNPPHILEEYSPQELYAMLIAMLQRGATVKAAIEALPSAASDLLAQGNTQLVHMKHNIVDDMCHSRAWLRAITTLQELAPFAPQEDRAGMQVCEIADWLARTFPLADDPDAPLPDLSPVAEIDVRGGSKKLWGSETYLKSAKEALKKLRDTYKSYTNRLLLQADDELEQRSARAIMELAALYRTARDTYSRLKYRQDILDFDDLISRTRTLLTSNDSVRQRWQAELSAVLVDEFQDTDDDQRAIIYALTGMHRSTTSTSIEDGSGNATVPSLFVVGDGKQSIYRFRGADVSVFRSVEQDIPKRGGSLVNLDTSFRTHPVLIDWINRVSEALFARQRELLPYEVRFEPLQAYRDRPDFHQSVELHVVAKEEAEAGDETDDDSFSPKRQQQKTSTNLTTRDIEAGILAERISALVNGDGGNIVYDHQQQTWRSPVFGDFAILLRASSAFPHYEQALNAAGIPYLTTAGSGYYAQKEVQDIIHLLHVLNDPMDELALVGVLRSPLFALDDATIVRMRFANTHSLWVALMQEGEYYHGDERVVEFARTTLRQLYYKRGSFTVVELLREALAATGYLATISGLEHGKRRRANVEKLLEITRQSDQAGLSDFSLYLRQLLQAIPREGEAPLEAEGVVRLMTVHASKGLEFPIVVLPDLGRKPPPQQSSWIAQKACGVGLRLRGPTAKWQKPLAYQIAAYEEQRMERAERERLFYVAVTRARDYLILSGPVAKKSKEDWMSMLLNALGYPWEDDGPPEGDVDDMRVWWHEG